MPNLGRKPLTDAEKKMLFAAVKELKNRGRTVPKEVRAIFQEKKKASWPVDPNGYFVKADGKSYRPSENQKSFVSSEARFSALYGPRGCGKALSIDTPILTPLGWKTMESIRVGDIVFDENGKQCNVTSVSPIMYNHKCYKVVFSDGSEIDADEEHLWITQNKEERNSGRFGKIRTTKYLSNTLLVGRTKKEVNHSIRITLPLEMEEKKLPVDPYYLGVWLGDGNSRDSGITSADLEIIEELSARGLICKKHQDKYSWSVKNPDSDVTRNSRNGRIESNKNNLVTKLRDLGILENKYIPKEYLLSSVEQRTDLLHGLMDTDGYSNGKGQAEFTSTSYKFAWGVYVLMCSLGMRPTWSTGVAKLYGREISAKYRIYVNTEYPLFKLKRKLDGQIGKPKQAQRHNQRFITGVIPIDSIPVRCITVDSTNHIYLAGSSLIPTHNSGGGAQKMLRKIMQGESGAVMNPDMENFKLSTWPEIKSWLPWKMVVKSQQHRKRPEWEPTKPFTMVFTNGAKLYCKGLKDPDSARGPNINFLWYDEAGRDKTGQGWKIAISSVRIGNNPQMWATFTPKNSEHWTTKFFVRQEISDDVKRQFADALGDDKILIECFHATREDNKENLDPGFYASVLVANPSGWLKSQEFDGEVADEGGQIGYRSWFSDRIVTTMPVRLIKKVRSWDTAGSEKKIAKDDPDESVGSLLAKFIPIENPDWYAIYKDRIPEGQEKLVHFILESQVSGFWIWEKLLEVIKNTARHDGPYVPVYIDQDPGGAGKNQVAAVAAAFKDERNPDLHSHQIHEVDVRRVGDRVLAANNHWFGVASEGRMWLMKSHWNEGFLGQLDGFTMVGHDDKITSVTSGMFVLNPYKKFARMPFVTI